MRTLALALATAALIATAARPWAPGAIAWVACVPLLFALAGERRGPRAALAGWVAALGAGVVAFEGVAVAAPWVYPLLVAVAGVPMALASGLFAAIRARLGTAAALASFPLLMTAAEFVPAQRALLGDFANALTPIATTQFDTPLRLLGAWSGASAVGLALWAVNVGVYVLVRDRRLRWPSAIALLPFALAFVPVPGTGGDAAGASLRVALVQGAVPSVDTLMARFDREAAARMLAPYGELTALAAERGADLVVWGETVLPQALRPGEVPEIASVALAAAPIGLVGGVSFTDGRAYNAIFHWRDGELTEVYRKQALVPLNERRYGAGIPLPPLGVAGVPVGLGICLDSVFGSLARGPVRAGAQLLVYLTEDGFAGRTVTPELHLRITAQRAIETGRWVVFANQSGPSAVIDARGRVVERIAQGDAAALLVTVPALAGVTPYVRYGDWLGPLAAIGSLATLGAAITARRRRGA